MWYRIASLNNLNMTTNLLSQPSELSIPELESSIELLEWMMERLSAVFGKRATLDELGIASGMMEGANLLENTEAMFMALGNRDGLRPEDCEALQMDLKGGIESSLQWLIEQVEAGNLDEDGMQLVRRFDDVFKSAQANFLIPVGNADQKKIREYLETCFRVLENQAEIYWSCVAESPVSPQNPNDSVVEVFANAVAEIRETIERAKGATARIQSWKERHEVLLQLDGYKQTFLDRYEQNYAAVRKYAEAMKVLDSSIAGLAKAAKGNWQDVVTAILYHRDGYRPLFEQIKEASEEFDHETVQSYIAGWGSVSEWSLDDMLRLFDACDRIQAEADNLVAEYEASEEIELPTLPEQLKQDLAFIARGAFLTTQLGLPDFMGRLKEIQAGKIRSRDVRLAESFFELMNEDE